jgi:hypothetical protein
MIFPFSIFSRDPTHINVLPKDYSLNHYQIVDVLNADTLGIVYLGINKAIQIKCLIKEFFPFQWAYRDKDGYSVQIDPQVRAEFNWGMEHHLNEAILLTKLNHPCVIHVMDFF